MNNRPLDRVGLAAAVEELGQRDPLLAAIRDQQGIPPMWARRPGFATLVRIILEQQVSLISARAVYRRLSRALGRVTPARVLRSGEQGLRTLGLTRQKSRYCCALANTIEAGALDLRALQELPRSQVEAQLTEVPGIGRWTSDIYCLMALRHPDVWPRGDLALYKAMRECLGTKPSAAELDAHARTWKPLRSVAARLLWLYYLETR